MDSKNGRRRISSEVNHLAQTREDTVQGVSYEGLWQLSNHNSQGHDDAAADFAGVHGLSHHNPGRNNADNTFQTHDERGDRGIDAALSDCLQRVSNSIAENATE